MRKVRESDSIRRYDGEEGIEIWLDDSTGRQVLVVPYDLGSSASHIDVEDLIQWLMRESPNTGISHK